MIFAQVPPVSLKPARHLSAILQYDLPGRAAAALSCVILAAVSDCLAIDILVEVCEGLCDLEGLRLAGRGGLPGLADPVSLSTWSRQLAAFSWPIQRNTGADDTSASRSCSKGCAANSDAPRCHIESLEVAGSLGCGLRPYAVRVRSGNALWRAPPRPESRERISRQLQYLVAALVRSRSQPQEQLEIPGVPAPLFLVDTLGIENKRLGD